MLVMTFGTFDRFHPGHEYYLREAKKIWTTLVTIVARDVTVEKIKWKSPHDTEDVRVSHVQASGISDRVILGSLEDPYRVILEERPDILCFWYDQNSFNDHKLSLFLEKHHLSPRVVRISAFRPEKWKSSLL